MIEKRVIDGKTGVKKIKSTGSKTIPQMIQEGANLNL